MKCSMISHENYETVGICLYIDCKLNSRLVCPKCLINVHTCHIDNILLFNDILETKKSDENYLETIPEILEFKNYSNEFIANKEIFQNLCNKVEINTSSIYDIILSGFENLNLGMKKALEGSLDVDIEPLQYKMKELEDNSIYNITSKLVSNSISSNEYENIFNNTIIEKLKDLKLTLSKKRRNEMDVTNLMKSENLDGQISVFYSDLRTDFNNIFKKYNDKIIYLNTSINPFIIQLLPNNHCKNSLGIKFENICNNGLYSVSKKAMCLIGSRPLFNKEKWKLVFENPTSFSCVGFGLGSLTDPKIHDILSTNNNNVLLCLCCNGPWSAKAMKISSSNIKLSSYLLSETNKEIIYEFDRNADRFRIYDSKNNLHSEFVISSLPLKENLTFIMNCTSGVNFNFRIISINI